MSGAEGGEGGLYGGVFGGADVDEAFRVGGGVVVVVPALLIVLLNHRPTSILPES